MSSTYGRNIKISIFGQSHSEAIGVVIDGFPPGFKLDFAALQLFMDRRAPGRNSFATPRKEADLPEFLSGLTGVSADRVSGVTCGAPIAAVIRNKDTRPSDYDSTRDMPRPGHADFTAQLKYKGAQDVSGGGHFSGRLTAPLCVAGGICLQYLKEKGIDIAAHIASVASIRDASFDAATVGKPEFDVLGTAVFPVLDEACGAQMLAAIEEARKDGDSLGGVIECAAVGLPGGLGDPMFDGMENRIAALVFGIPAVKGIEFGSGFAGAALRGSDNNDSFYFSAADDGTQDTAVKTRSNNHGGILGGITSGMPVLFRVAVKPTPSIAGEQFSVSLSGKSNVKMTIKGRHDPCIVPRAVPVVEAAAAIAILDALLENNNYR
jgi:chorismate synthase